MLDRYAMLEKDTIGVIGYSHGEVCLTECVHPACLLPGALQVAQVMAEVNAAPADTAMLDGQRVLQVRRVASAKCWYYGFIALINVWW